MIGTKWPSEKHTFLDPVSGQPVTQLTDQYLNFHLYFTDNSFDPSCENIYFQSNRCNPESERCQLFRMNLESGEMEQLTDDPAGGAAPLQYRDPGEHPALRGKRRFYPEQPLFFL